MTVTSLVRKYRRPSKDFNSETESEANEIIDLGIMLVSLLAGCPDYHDVPDGIRLTIWHMVDKARAIQERHAS